MHQSFTAIPFESVLNFSRMGFHQPADNATAHFGTYNDVQGDQHNSVSDSYNTTINGVAGIIESPSIFLSDILSAIS